MLLENVTLFCLFDGGFLGGLKIHPKWIKMVFWIRNDVSK